MICPDYFVNITIEGFNSNSTIVQDVNHFDN